jgi:hypothetical protein
MSFSVKLFTLKRNLVFMNNLSYKVAVASVCTALSFVLGASEEVKAATITVPPTIQFGVSARYNPFGPEISRQLSSQFDRVGSAPTPSGGFEERFAEFNISSFFITPNTIIKSAVLQDKFSTVIGNRFNSPTIPLGIFGYIGNGTAEVSDSTNDGVFLSSLTLDLSSLSPGDTLNFDVTTFVNQQVSNGNPFAGFVIRILGFSSFSAVSLGGTDALGRSSLVIETVDAAEPVPEPTTIFGSALALSLGGWLKRKKLSPQNKTPSQG